MSGLVAASGDQADAKRASTRAIVGAASLIRHDQVGRGQGAPGAGVPCRRAPRSARRWCIAPSP